MCACLCDFLCVAPLGQWQKEREAKAYRIWHCQAVSHPRTDRAWPTLASEVRRDWSRSGCYKGRQHFLKFSFETIMESQEVAKIVEVPCPLPPASPMLTCYLILAPPGRCSFLRGTLQKWSWTWGWPLGHHQNHYRALLGTLSWCSDSRLKRQDNNWGSLAG